MRRDVKNSLHFGGPEASLKLSETEHALINAVQNYDAEVHVCGYHIHETTQRKNTAGAWVPYFVVCEACRVLHKAQVAQAKKDGNKDVKENPESYRVWRVEWWSLDQIRTARAKGL